MSIERKFRAVRGGIKASHTGSLSTVRSKSKVLAIFLADVHLSLKPPIWRSAEPDWLEAQARPLDEVKSLQKKYDCPVICAGDIFDKWNSSPELINFALANLPDSMYAIPGQHDLPNHQYDDIERSAYWTLVKACKITDISNDLVNITSSGLTLYGFPYNRKIEACKNSSTFLQVAVVHDYIWKLGRSYPNPSINTHFETKRKQLGGYDVAVYGDNHKGFLTQLGETQIFNCGTLMRRKSDESGYVPQVGLLLDAGVVIPHFLDISKDEYIVEAKERVESSLEMRGFFDELEKLGKTALDFREAMKEFLQGSKMSDEVKQIILKAMEK